jgi:hypothetical protein
MVTVGSLPLAVAAHVRRAARRRAPARIWRAAVPVGRLGRVVVVVAAPQR